MDPDKHTTSEWTLFYEEVKGDIHKAAFDCLKNFAIIGLLLSAIKKAFDFNIIGGFVVALVLLIPIVKLLYYTFKKSVLVGVFWLFGVENEDAKVLLQKGNFWKFFYLAKGPFIAGVIISGAVMVSGTFLIWASVK
jgi:hypothetical protein